MLSETPTTRHNLLVGGCDCAGLDLLAPGRWIPRSPCPVQQNRQPPHRPLGSTLGAFEGAASSLNHARPRPFGVSVPAVDLPRGSPTQRSQSRQSVRRVAAGSIRPVGGPARAASTQPAPGICLTASPVNWPRLGIAATSWRTRDMALATDGSVSS